ncbi:MAG TPA: branched-chain amino acid transport system II carrier protein [Defluviitaleaceae bacterium]|jgi:LIVCS family branched-chain amino acid:cation transporter|nr:branched-chain amino acid transport system II carrier protein [Defluviitaleaceae bacterium]HPT76715.1 branched-chain amino acid transport system II carrier protein [Defluviitaleaceae bacterium]
MKERLGLKSNILIGSLLFGLFFGAGNLIFPVYMGQLAGQKTLEATVGFLITGVGLPLLGVIASALSKSDSLFDMAKPVSKAYSVFFTCMLYLTIGPLFAIPRTASVAFEVGLNPFVPKEYLQLALFIFSFLFFAMTLYFSLKPSRILDWVGKYLTPVFLLLLSVLIFAVFLKPMGQANQYEAQGAYVQKAFFTGLLEGYNTMDALASLAFAIVIISNIEKLGVRDSKRKAIETAKSGLVCVIGMGLIYTSLAYMGATSLGAVGRASNGGQIMSLVSEHYFGNTGKILLAAIVTVACLKTAIGLITSCSQMFSRLFPKSLSYNQYAVFFTIISFIIANFGLNKIIQLSIPVLMFLYPLAIVLIVLSLLSPVLNKAEEVYKWTTVLTVFASFFDFCNALPDVIKKTVVINSLIEFARTYLPGFNIGFGWLIPALAGFITGFTLWKVRGRSLEQ